MTFLNIAAIHTTSKLLAQVLFNLATYTSYIEPLREEISTIIDAEGWNKVSLEKMRKLDSFVKESQRLHGTEASECERHNKERELMSCFADEQPQLSGLPPETSHFQTARSSQKVPT
jgi:cytochrome P450